MSSEKQETHQKEARESAPAHDTVRADEGDKSSLPATETQDDEDEDNTPTAPRLHSATRQSTNTQQDTPQRLASPGSDNWFSSQLPTGFLLEGEDDNIPSGLWLKIAEDSGPLPNVKSKPHPTPKLEDKPALTPKTTNASIHQPERASKPAPKPLIEPFIPLEEPLFPLSLEAPEKPEPVIEQATEHTEPAFEQAPKEPEPVVALQTDAPEQAPANTKQTLPSISSKPARPTPSPISVKAPKTRRRLQRLYLLVAVALIVLVILSGVIFTLTNLLNHNNTDALSLSSSAPSSLSSKQIDELRHLSTRMKYKQLASLYVARMSLDEEIGQLIMVEYGDTYYSDDIKSMIKDLHAGGVIMYEFQMQTASQTKQDIEAMQQDAKIPLLISTDEEGGIVERLSNIYPARPSALDIYNTGDPQVAADQGKKVAQDLLALGINTNLAPSVDVQLVNGPGQTTRTFGYTADSVIKFAGPYIKAMQQQGVIATIKHFPGMGASTIDPHDGLPVIARTKEQLYQTELAPFKYFIQSKDKLENPGIVMPTDVLMTAIDSVYPAELSHKFMTDILRKEFGYDGVSLTDALYMKGVTINGEPITMSQAGVMALQAGNDMLLGPTGYTQALDMVNAIKAALQNGTLSKSHLDEAATRIIALKMQSHLMPATPPQN